MIGFSKDLIELMTSYVFNRKQYMEVNGTLSEILVTNAISVTQDFTLSGFLYQVFILNISMLFHKISHKPLKYGKCKETKNKTYVEDHFPE